VTVFTASKKPFQLQRALQLKQTKKLRGQDLYLISSVRFGSCRLLFFFTAIVGAAFRPPLI